MKGKPSPLACSRIQDILSWCSAVAQLKVTQKARGGWGERGVLFSRGTLVPLISACCFLYRVFPHVDSNSVHISLRKQPTFSRRNTGFPVKSSLRNDCRNFILITYQYPDLGSASDWLKQIPFAVRARTN